MTESDLEQFIKNWYQGLGAEGEELPRGTTVISASAASVFPGRMCVDMPRHRPRRE